MNGEKFTHRYPYKYHLKAARFPGLIQELYSRVVELTSFIVSPLGEMMWSCTGVAVDSNICSLELKIPL